MNPSSAGIKIGDGFHGGFLSLSLCAEQINPRQQEGPGGVLRYLKESRERVRCDEHSAVAICMSRWLYVLVLLVVDGNLPQDVKQRHRQVRSLHCGCKQCNGPMEH